jgi:proteasome lid subunit RPN8/RPN11
MVVDNAVLGTIHAHLREKYPHEACGFLIGLRGAGDGPIVIRAYPVPNRRETDGGAANRYLITPEDFMAAEGSAEQGSLVVIGTYHSHPDVSAEPSEYDQAHAWPWYQYLIVSVRNGQIAETRAWELTEDRKHFKENPVDISEPQSCP